MSFAQPIRRRPSSSTVSPGWLTNGIARSAGSTGGYGYGYTTSPGGANWGMHGGGSASGSGSGLSSADWSYPGSRRETETGSRQHEQELINAYEAEEERIINVLSRKLEQLREDKIELENALEAESESHVNKLLRELGALRVANGELEARAAEAEEKASVDGSGEGSSTSSMKKSTVTGRKSTEESTVRKPGTHPNDPSVRSLLDAMQRENELLRSRLVDAERNYVRLSRLNEIYREELIEHRTRLGLPLDNLAGLTPSDRDPLSQPIHRRPTRDSRSSSISGSSSPGAPPLGGNGGQLQGFIGATASPRNMDVTIPRPPSQIHRPSQIITSPIPMSNSQSTSSQLPSPALYSPSDGYAPSSSSQSISSSPVSPYVPIHSRTAPILLTSSRGGAHSSARRQDRRYSNGSSTSYAGSLTDATSGAGADPGSVSTGITSPPDSVVDVALAGTFGGITPQRTLTYPSVPPPSLSSSFGSPAAIFQIHTHLAAQNSARPRDSRDPSMSPVEPLSRRGSVSQAGERRVAETGSLRRGSFRTSNADLPVGGRVAESGSLIDVARSRASSFGASAEPTSSATAASRPSTVVEGDAEDLELEGL